ncbi:Uncharacterised protein [Burkholderia pseudomallei]|uniref:hypothetical protein n=1 Tax=Burkholderia pseudomallei TaxID=28450 RepID=UPI000F11201D|nr:hypothetical protein [Burkholderia pseudomallei]CAJ2972224.1 Uncharacterised protein [Burkholderia pseudomallei]CAJ3224196.1 Uncharacterised protein [Burkholderia pseudomallei]CAJ3234118.1 Uncharacterised protein [Burkholderia pseudomallei]CAJ9626074.1 Uncharacterised protein [Burkholderia pseudomallei]CAK0254502.1 Uncharacterised protein [Burkholderia pseudomallei]
MQNNIEKFDELVANVFANLYENFPVRISLFENTFGYDLSHRFSPAGDVIYNSPDDEKFFSDTLNWLRMAGYIDFHISAHGPWGKAVLTAKGLEVLKATPSSISPAQPLGAYLAEGIRTGAKNAVTKGVTFALSHGASLAWNVITTGAGS